MKYCTIVIIYIFDLSLVASAKDQIDELLAIAEEVSVL